MYISYGQAESYICTVCSCRSRFREDIVYIFEDVSSRIWQIKSMDHQEPSSEESVAE